LAKIDIARKILMKDSAWGVDW